MPKLSATLKEAQLWREYLRVTENLPTDDPEATKAIGAAYGRYLLQMRQEGIVWRLDGWQYNPRRRLNL